jgi:hypothetical protein
MDGGYQTRVSGVLGKAIGNVGFMDSDIPDPVEPEVDEEPERAPGGADADLNESDVGAGSEGTPVTPDVPLSAQQDQAQVPDEVQTPEEPEETEATERRSASEPSA